MTFDIEFDPVKAAANLQKHGVSFTQAEQVLRDPYAITIEDGDSEGERRFVSIGMDATDRLLVVVHAPRGPRTRLIPARKATRRERDQYHA